MKALIGAVALCLLSVSIVEGQTISEQLQRAIYTQSTLGDLDGAIRIYQQIIATSPVNSEIRTQAERLMAAAEAYRLKAGPPALATFDGNVYRHRRTNITFEVPRGWKVLGTNPSSDDGEQMYITITDPKDPASTARAESSVWMIAFPAEIDRETIEQKLYAAPLEKMRQRGQPGYLNLENWTLREGSTRRLTVGGQPAVAALADYRDNGRAMVEAMVWVVTNKSRAFFALRLSAEEYKQGMLTTFDAMVSSAKVP